MQSRESCTFNSFFTIRGDLMLDIKDRIAVVTGGSRGIGAAASILLAKAGENVAVLYAADRAAAVST